MSTPNAFRGFLGLGEGLDSYAMGSGVTFRLTSLRVRGTVGDSNSSSSSISVSRGRRGPVRVTEVKGDEAPNLLVLTDDGAL